MDKELSLYEVMRTFDVYPEFGPAHRIEILKTSNPKEPYSANCYVRAEDGEGYDRWKRKCDFPWIGARTEEAARDEALQFLKERL